MSKEQGNKFDNEKIRPDLIPGSAIEALGEVLKIGANKYNDRNWEKGIEWDRIFGALERHLNAIKRGEDYDKEDGLLHISHLLTNAVFLNEYYKSFPQGDRFERIIHPFHGKKIALDIDGVICDFNSSFAKLMSKTGEDVVNWYYSYLTNETFEKLDYDFWINLPSHFSSDSLCFEPTCYITHRNSDAARKATPEWLEKNKFPCMPIIFVDNASDKGEEAKKHNIDIIIDDKFKNFYRLNNSGILCFLQDRPWNKKYDVGHLRVQHPNDIFKYRLRKI